MDAMTATADPTATAATDLTARARNLLRTGGPEDASSWLEHVLGWTLVVVVAMFVTQVGWL
nr:SCO1431 family membrane protein [Streptomyces sp. ADI91-18]